MLPRAVRAAVSGARRAGAQLRGRVRQRRQPRSLGGDAARAVRAAARGHARGAVRRQLRPAPRHPGRLRLQPRPLRDHARCGSAEPARGDRPRAGRARCRPRLRRHHPPAAPGCGLAPLRLALHQRDARAHHAGAHHRSGLHVPRLRAQRRRCGQPVLASTTPSCRHSPIPSPMRPTEIEVAHEERGAGESKYSLLPADAG